MTDGGGTPGGTTLGGQRRRSGWLRPGGQPTPSDHACCSYASDAQRAEVVTSWLTDGALIAQRTMYVGDGPVEALRAHLAGVPDLDEALDTGRLVIASAADLYDIGAPIQPAEQLAVYDGAVEQAIADGYNGLRVAADITPLVLDDALHRSHLEWEQFADRYMTQRPLAPLCTYDARRVPALAAISAVHPLQGPQEPAFALFGGGPNVAALEGEIDACTATTLAEVLAGLPDTDRRLDVERLAFVDARAASVVYDELRRRWAAERPLSIVGASGMFRKIWDLCGFDAALIAA